MEPSLSQNMPNHLQEKEIDAELLAPELRSPVLLKNPITGHSSTFSKYEVIDAILNELSKCFCNQYTSCLNGSYIVNLFGGGVYSVIHDLDWKIEITNTTFNQPEMSLKVQSIIIAKIAFLVFRNQHSDQQSSKQRVPQDFAIRMTTLTLPDHSFLARYCFQAARGLPLELSLHINLRSSTHLMYNLYIPLRSYEEGLGSNQAGKYLLCSQETTTSLSIDEVISFIQKKVIVYNPDPEYVHPDKNKWLRLQIAITEGSLIHSEINDSWLTEAAMNRIAAADVTGWALYKREESPFCSFFLLLNGLLSSQNHPLFANNLLREFFRNSLCIANQAPIFSWTQHLSRIFQVVSWDSQSLEYDFFSEFYTLLNLFLPLFADEITIRKHRDSFHLHARFNLEWLYFVPFPISIEPSSYTPSSTFLPLARYQAINGAYEAVEYEENLCQELVSLLKSNSFDVAAKTIMSSQLLMPKEREALSLMITGKLEEDSSFTSYMQAALFWKSKNSKIFQSHLRRALTCENQDLSECREMFLEMSDPFDFDQISRVLPFDLAMTLALHENALFGPTRPLAFYCNCAKNRIIDPLIAPSLKIIEKGSSEQAWKVYRYFEGIPEVLEAIEKKPVPTIISQSDRETYRSLCLPTMKARLRAIPSQEVLNLVLLARSLGARSSEILPHVIRFLKAFPYEIDVVQSSIPELQIAINRQLLLENFFDSTQFINALASCNLKYFSKDQLVSLAVDAFSKLIALPPADFEAHLHLLATLFKELSQEKQKELLGSWVEQISQAYCSSLDFFSPSFWSEMQSMLEGGIKGEKKWKKLFIHLVFHLSPSNKTSLFLDQIERATRTIEYSNFPKLFPSDDIEKWSHYNLKAACHLREGNKESSLNYLKVFLSLPYSQKGKYFFNNLYGDDPFNFNDSFPNLSSLTQQIHLLAYQETVVDIKTLLPFYAALYQRNPNERKISEACQSAMTRALQDEDLHIAWKYYPIFHLIQDLADRIESLELTLLAQNESCPSTYISILKNRFLVARQENKHSLFNLLNVLKVEQEQLACLLTEEFKSTQEIPVKLSGWYSQLASQITPRLGRADIHRLTVLLSATHSHIKMMGWQHYLNNFPSYSIDEGLFYLKSASDEEKREFLQKLLDHSLVSSLNCQKLFNAALPINEDISSFFSSLTWNSHTLQIGFAILSENQSTDSVINIFSECCIDKISTCLTSQDLLTKIFPYLRESSKDFLRRKYQTELEEEIKKSALCIENHISFLTKTKNGKFFLKDKEIFTIFLKIVQSHPKCDVNAVLNIISSEFFEEPLAYKQCLCLWKMYSSMKTLPQKILERLADKISFSLDHPGYFPLYCSISSSFPLFESLVMDRWIAQSNSQQDNVKNLTTLYRLSDNFEKKHLSPLAEYIKDMYVHFPISITLKLAQKLYHHCLKNKEEGIALNLLLEVIEKHSQREEMTPESASFYLSFFLLSESLDFLWDIPKIEALFMRASSEYLYYHSSDFSILSNALKTLQVKTDQQLLMNEEQYPLILQYAHALNRDPCFNESRFSAIFIKTIIPALFNTSLSPENDESLENFLIQLFVFPYCRESVDLIQELFSRIVEYLHLTDESSIFTKQSLMQICILLAFKYDMKSAGKEIALNLYNKLPCLNSLHINFLTIYHFHRFLFLDGDLYHSFLRLVERHQRTETDSQLNKKIASLLFSTQCIPKINTEQFNDTMQLYLTVTLPYATDVYQEETKPEPIPPLGDEPKSIKTLKSLVDSLTIPSFLSNRNDLIQLNETLDILSDLFENFSLENKLMIRDQLPDLTSRLIDLSQQLNDSQIANCSQKLFFFANFFVEIDIIRRLGKEIHEVRIKKCIDRKNLNITKDDIEMYIHYLDIFYDREMNGSSLEALKHASGLDCTLWSKMLSRENKQASFRDSSAYISYKLLQRICKYIEFHSTDSYLYDLSIFLIDYFTKKTNDSLFNQNIKLKLSGIDRDSKKSQFIEELLFYTYTSHPEENTPFKLIEEMQDASFFLDIGTLAIKRGDDELYSLKVALIVLKKLELTQREHSILIDETLKAICFCEWSNFEFIPFFSYFIKLDKEAKTEKSNLFFEGVEQAKAFISRISCFDDASICSLSSFIGLALACCPDYSEKVGACRISKETIIEMLVPLIKYDVLKLIDLVRLLVKNQKKKVVNLFIVDLINELDQRMQTNDFFTERDDVLFPSSIAMAAEVSQHLQKFYNS